MFATLASVAVGAGVPECGAREGEIPSFPFLAELHASGGNAPPTCTALLGYYRTALVRLAGIACAQSPFMH